VYLFEVLYHGQDSLLALSYTERRSRLTAALTGLPPADDDILVPDVPDRDPVPAPARVVTGGQRLASHPSKPCANTVGSLLMGVIDVGDRLRYAGNDGTGFTEAMLREQRPQLGPLQRDTSPFSMPTPPANDRSAHWVDPSLVGEVVFTGWTAGGSMRHSSRPWLRTDKNPRMCTGSLVTADLGHPRRRCPAGAGAFFKRPEDFELSD
jgi:ATP-dependent DNA ligase